MTQYLPFSKPVPRHSYTPGNLYPDARLADASRTGQKPRPRLRSASPGHGVPVLHRDPPAGGAKVEAPWPVLRQVTPTNFIAVPLAFSSTTPDD